MTLFTIGYGRWPTKQRMDRLLRALKDANVNTLVDIRHSPCSSDLRSESNYGPRDWHVQAGGAGIAQHLKEKDIDYIWLVELGNPQKHDAGMAVLRDHIASGSEQWPVNRGLRLLRNLLAHDGKVCCLLCACKNYDECHRKVIAEAVGTRFPETYVNLRDLSTPEPRRHKQGRAVL